MKHDNIHIIGIPEGKEREQGLESMFEKIMTENFPNLLKKRCHTSSGSTESPNQDEPKMAHCKISPLKWQNLKTKREY